MNKSCSRTPGWRTKFWGALSLVAALSLSCNNSAQSTSPIATMASQDTVGNDSGSAYLQVDSDSLTVHYGTYAESEVSLLGDFPSGDVEWVAVDTDPPAGLSLEQSTSSQVLIFGTPEFVGPWCFTLAARIGGSIQAEQQLCYVSLEDTQIPHPSFLSDRVLPEGIVGASYDQILSVSPGNSALYAGSLFDGVLPDGIQVSSHTESSSFEISGTPTTDGVSVFALSVKDNEGIQTYKQFQVQVDPTAQTTPTCAPGYYWDAILKECVQDQLETCPIGTYYDATDNICVAYPQPPPGVYCAPGEYFDPFLSECVGGSYPHCPLNYYWDNFENRCEPRIYSCPIGYRYDWDLNECVYVWDQSCPDGTHWDPYVHSCVINCQPCAPGWHWDPRDERCEPSHRQCPPGTFWDPRDNRCEEIHQGCRPGFHWDGNDCEPNMPPPPVHSCPSGTHWSPAQQECVANANPPPPPMPPPHPMPPPPMPPPAPMPPPKPMPPPAPMPPPPPAPMPPPPPAPMPPPPPAPMPPPPPAPMPPPPPAPMPPPPPAPMPPPPPAPMPPPPPAPMPPPHGKAKDVEQSSSFSESPELSKAPVNDPPLAPLTK